MTMDFLTLMLLSESNDHEKIIFFMNKVYQRRPCKGFHVGTEYPEENNRYVVLKKYFDEHPAVRNSLIRMKKNMDKGNEFILPIFFDHFLCLYWERLFTTNVKEYILSVNLRLEQNIENFSFYKGGKMLKKLLKSDWLHYYKSVEGLVKLNQECHKISQPIFTKVFSHLLLEYQEYQIDFNAYIKDVLPLIKLNYFVRGINDATDLLDKDEKESVFIHR